MRKRSYYAKRYRKPPGEECNCESLLQVHNRSNFLRGSSPRISTAAAVWAAAATASSGPIGDDGRNEWAGSGATTFCTTARSVGRNEWAGSGVTTFWSTARSVGRNEWADSGVTTFCTTARPVSLRSVYWRFLDGVATAMQKITTELNVAISEEDKIVAIAKIVIKLMNHNVQWILQASQSSST
jgi:hypothetical protein